METICRSRALLRGFWRRCLRGWWRTWAVRRRDRSFRVSDTVRTGDQVGLMRLLIRRGTGMAARIPKKVNGTTVMRMRIRQLRAGSGFRIDLDSRIAQETRGRLRLRGSRLIILRASLR